MLKLNPKLKKGSIWDEGGKSELVQILISHEQKKIKSLQFAYVEKGDVRHSKVYGELSGLKFNIVTFDYPLEFLTSMSGVYDDYEGLKAIAFGSNKRMYGPFGWTTVGDAPAFENTPFSSDNFHYEFGPTSVFAGFHGSVNDSRVNAIGIYIKPIMSLAELKPIKTIVEPETKESHIDPDHNESLAELNIK